MHSARQVTPLDAPDAVRGTVIEHEALQARPQTGGRADCGAVLHSGAMAEACLLNRVGRVLQDISAGRGVSDTEIRQHEADCRRLSEICYERFQQSHNPTDREDAVLWQHRAAEAHSALSPAWKAAREAEILQAIGAGYFVDQGDAARAALARGAR